MRLLRRLAAPLAILLATVVAGEVTDLLPCADTDCGLWSLVTGGPEGTAPEGTAPEGGVPDATPAPACLCHAVFAMDAAVPRVPAPDVAVPPSTPATRGVVSAGPTDVPHPPPLG